MANSNEDIVRAEFANDAAITAGGIIIGQLGFSLTTPYRMFRRETAGTYRQWSSDLGDRTQTGKLTVSKTTEQLRLQYDASNYTGFTITAAGQLTLSVNAGAGGPCDIVLTPATDNITFKTGGNNRLVINAGTAIQCYLALVGGVSGTDLVLQNSSLAGCKINSDGDLQMDSGKVFRAGATMTYGTATVTGTFPFKDSAGATHHFAICNSAAS